MVAAKIAHKEARHKKDLQIAQPVHSRRPKYNSLWLAYYGYRNIIWLTKGAGSSSNNMRLIARHMRRLAEVMIYDDHKVQRIKFWNAAFLDGWTGRFRNDRPKQLLR